MLFLECTHGCRNVTDSLDWYGKRDIIRKVVKRIEISQEKINIVYKVAQLADHGDDNMQHCLNRKQGSVRASMTMKQNLINKLNKE